MTISFDLTAENGNPPRWYPTDTQRPGESIREWVARLNVQENLRLGSVKERR